MNNQQFRQDDGDFRDINLRRIAQVLLKRAWMIVLFSVVMAVAVYIYSAAFVTPMYRTGFKAIIYNRMTTEKDTTSTSDLTASVGLTYIYNEILTSRRVLMEAAEKCGLEMSYGALSSTVSTSVSESAPVVYVYVSMTDPKLATRFATAISQVAPAYVNTLPLSSAMIVIDPPMMPAGKYAPNNTLNAMMGFGAGFLLACVVAIVSDMIGDKVNNGMELEQRYHVSIIGDIPDFQHAAKAGYYYYASNQKGGDDR